MPTHISPIHPLRSFKSNYPYRSIHGSLSLYLFSWFLTFLGQILAHSRSVLMAHFLPAKIVLQTVSLVQRLITNASHVYAIKPVHFLYEWTPWGEKKEICVYSVYTCLWLLGCWILKCALLCLSTPCCNCSSRRHFDICQCCLVPLASAFHDWWFRIVWVKHFNHSWDILSLSITCSVSPSTAQGCR